MSAFPPLHSRVAALGNRRLALMAVVLIGVFAYFLRCLHLFGDAYYIVSPDSHYFNWMARLVQSGETQAYRFSVLPELQHSGITYPVAYLARAMSSIFGMAPGDSLAFAGKFLPPLLALISVIVIYFFVSRIYDRRVALFATFTWAVLPNAVLIQGAGYLDRDGLSVTLVMMGAFIFYLSRDWHWQVRNVDLGWVWGCVLVLAIEALLYLEWLWLGPALLLAILGAFFAARVLLGFYSRVAPAWNEPDLAEIVLGVARRTPASFLRALRQSPWKPLGLVLIANVVATAVTPGYAALYDQVADAFSEVTSGTAMEMRGLTTSDIFSHWFVVVPLGIGVYVAARRRGRADVFLLSWAACTFVLGLIARRMFLYITPALAVVCGIGLAAVFDFKKSSPDTHTLRKAVGAILLVVMLFVGAMSGYGLAANPRVAADSDWQDALAYLRDHTPQEARVMCWWDYGYRVLDMAERTPVVDNGYHPKHVDNDIARVYCATEDAEAVEIMQTYRADYVVFSEVEEKVLSSIAKMGMPERYEDPDGGPVEYEEWHMQDSLYRRAIDGVLPPGGRFDEVYRNDTVVILAPR